MSKRFTKRPVTIEAVQWTGTNKTAISVFVGDKVTFSDNADHSSCLVFSLEGIMMADAGDWIIKGVKGEFYPIKDDIFRETYEAVDDAT